MLCLFFVAKKGKTDVSPIGYLISRIIFNCKISVAKLCRAATTFYNKKGETFVSPIFAYVGVLFATFANFDATTAEKQCAHQD